jgi:Ca2+-binding EF-hand superfamily protein
MSISGISGTDSYYYLSQLLRQSGSSSRSSSSSLSDLFASIDANGDGSISKSELATLLNDQDGSLMNSVMGSRTDSASLVSLLQDAAQLDSATGTTASMDQLFGKIDASGDGSISKDELQAFESTVEAQSGSAASGSDTSAVDRLFGAIDTNGDGSISKSEIETFASQVESAMSAPPPPNWASSLDNLFQGLGVDGSSVESTGSTSGAATSSSSASSTTSTSDQTNSASAFMAIIMEAISKYMQFGQAATGTTNTLSVSG